MRRPRPASDERCAYHTLEIPYGRFERLLRLPPGLDTDAAQASYRDGLLQINLVRRIPEAMKPRRIQIDAGAEKTKDKGDTSKTIDHIRAAS